MLGSLWERGKLKLAVDSATSAADEPTPIYVLDELVQALAAGDSRAGVDAVCARLAHRSPVVKQKALKVVAHIGRKGSPDLRRLMARHSGAVRDLLHFRCEPDPFKGDTVWKRVQEYAQEALNAIHAEPEAAAPSSSGLRGRIQGFGSEAGSGYSGGSGIMGFGSEPAGGYSGGGGGSGGRMVGFGSADVMQSGMQAISSGMRTLSGGRYDDYSSAQLDGGSGYAGGYSSGSSSRPGAGGLAQGPIIQAGAVTAPPAPASSGAAAGAGGAGGAAEQRAVDRICTPAGLRTAPSRDDLRGFVDAIALLDGAAVARLLQRKLEAGPWQASLRALCAIEAAVESSSQAACGKVAAHFKAHPEAVRAAADSPQASVRQRAQKLLGVLGGDAAAPAAPGSNSAAGGQLFTEDLLGEAEGGASGPSSAAAGGLADLLGEPAAAAQAPASSSTGAGADLLAGLDVPAAAAASSQPPPLQPSAAAPAAAAHAAIPDDLFGGMLLDSQPGGSSAPPAAAAPTAPAAPAAPAIASPLDLLGGLSLGGASASAPAAMPTAATPPAASAAAAAAAPGFDDLLGGLSLGAAPAAPAMGSARANGAASGLPLQPGGGLPGGPLGGGSAGWAVAPMGSAAQPSLGGAPAGLVPQGAAGGGLNSHAPFHQPGAAAGLGGLPGLHYAQQPAQPPARLPSLGSLGSGTLPSGALAHSGILDSQRDNAFNFVDDALAAAKRKH